MKPQVNYPTFDEYQAALQSPNSCLSKLVFKDGQIDLDLWGIPKVRSGGFALTYRVQTQTSAYAIRCFHRNAVNRLRRYQMISSHLEHIKSPYLVTTRYHPRGIQLGSQWYPITTMPWVEGETLETYIQRHLGNPELFSGLAAQFVEIIRDLRNSGIAHGDLSHQNILVHDGRLMLVDYDGMYVKGMDRLGSIEVGHSHFQHPARTIDQFGPNLDNFSAIVIYLALTALAIHPALWNKFESAGDGLMFRKEDFLSPYSSPLLQEIETYSSLRKLVGAFRQICLASMERVPTLDQFLAGDYEDLPREEKLPDPTEFSREGKPMDPTMKVQMGQRLGQTVTVIGRVTDVFEGNTRDGHPHLFLNFGNWRAKCFTVVLWGEAYRQWKEKSDAAENMYLDRWVSVHGTLTSYKNRMQIAFDEPFGLEILPDEYEARRRLGVQTIFQMNNPIERKHPVDEQVSVPKPPDPVRQQPDLAKWKDYSDYIDSRIDELYRKSK
jgi:serine/threonine protein kinase